MAKSDRKIFLLSLVNDEALNELDRQNRYNTYEYILCSKFIPSFFNKSKWLQILFVFLVVIFSPLWNCYFLFRALNHSLRKPITPYKGKKLFLLASPALPKVVKNAGIKVGKEDRWIELPWLHYEGLEGVEHVSVFNIITLKDVVSTYCDSVLVIFYLLRKKGIRFTMPALKAFRWFLYNRAIRHIPLDVELLFSNHKNSYAVLFDYLPHAKKILLQHGTEILMENPNNIVFPFYQYNKIYNFWSQNLPFKYKHISELYCFSEKERIALSMSIVNCNPKIHIVGYSLKAFNENLEGEAAILIIGYYSLFYEREKQLLSKLNDCGLRIYLKNHPNFSEKVYDDIINKYNFTLLNGARFPKVNVVFTYSSTLALEYEDLGVDIILYDKLSDDELEATVKKTVAEIKAKGNVK